MYRGLGNRIRHVMVEVYQSKHIFIRERLPKVDVRSYQSNLFKFNVFHIIHAEWAIRPICKPVCMNVAMAYQLGFFYCS